MVQIVRANQRQFSNFGWLKTHWLFSFSNYYDPQNVQFGALRVFNDDIVEPGTGFPTHPHQEMEIVTIVLEGEITHQDSMGNETVIKAGDVQRMSAGTGLTHSEFNLADIPVHFYQIWIYPDVKGLKPAYDQKHYKQSLCKDKFFAVASGQGIEDTVTFHTNATIYKADLNHGKHLEFKTNDSRRIFVYVTDGEVEINREPLQRKDQARIDLVNLLEFKALSDTSLILIDVPSCKGWGYDEKTLKGERR